MVWRHSYNKASHQLTVLGL